MVRNLFWKLNFNVVEKPSCFSFTFVEKTTQRKTKLVSEKI
jgi:hypothetical protein